VPSFEMLFILFMLYIVNEKNKEGIANVES